MAEITSATSTKRQRIDASSATNASDENDDDSIIGIDCGGQVFFTHKSTLTAGSTYFAARFGGSFNAGACRKDEYGRDVYFVDADPDTFRCILSYLRRGLVSWPDWADDPRFHQRLVAEAEYFGLDAAVVEKLKCVASIKYDPVKEDGKGIFYWLGTKYGKGKYENPYDLDEVSFSGYLKHPSTDMDLHKRKFIQFRPKCDGLYKSYCINDGVNCDSRLLWCHGAANGDTLVIQLMAIAVRPTHYSLRFGDCGGMQDWNFEASVDGKNWETLHKARNDPHLTFPIEKWDVVEKSIKEFERGYMEEKKRGQEKVTHEQFLSMKVDIFTGFAEENLRHTWGLCHLASSFYRFFRIVGPGSEISPHGCLHGVGFELYGDVQALRENSAE